MTTLTLPYPPSANRLWRNLKGKTVKSAEYRQWLHDGTVMIIAQRPRKMLGAYHLKVVATRPDRRQRDIDNLLKPVGDLLALCGVISNDCMAQSVYAGWSDVGPIPGGAVVVTLEPHEAA